jgi:L-aminopeptidase/D-esterase-like protein
VYVGNGFGKMIGATQIEELGVLESPIVLANTLSVWRAAEALAEYVLQQKGNENVRSVNVVVGETNDGGLNDIRGMHVQKTHAREALAAARGGPVEEGCIGAGTGTRTFGFKGGNRHVVARTGSPSTHGSGDYVIAFSTAAVKRSRHGASAVSASVVFRDDEITPLFEATVEATEEAIYNSTETAFLAGNLTVSPSRMGSCNRIPLSQDNLPDSGHNLFSLRR